MEEYVERSATLNRNTKETQISCELNIDGDGSHTINTGIGFLDHMVSALAKHAGYIVANALV